MNLIIALPLLVCILGLVIYLVSTANAKVAEIGRLAFAVGLLVALIEFATKVIHF